MVGTTLGPYRIIEKLGAGGMGEVYRAHDATLERDVAIKVLPAGLADEGGEALERLRREAKLLATLNHPNVATIHSIEESETGPFLVLELVEGMTLAERLSRRAEGGAGGSDSGTGDGRGGDGGSGGGGDNVSGDNDGSPRGMPVQEVIDTCGQIARGLAAAHNAGVVHRDLKPANVMIGPDGLVKILDFGISKATTVADEAAATQMTLNSALTTEGTLLGTIPYMSPELIRGRPADARSDTWALGCLMHEALTGRTAFARETMADTLSAILEHEPARLDESRVPVTVADLIARCLRKDPDERPQAMSGVVDVLDEAGRALGETAVHRAASGWKTVAAAAVIIATVAAGAAWLSFRQMGIRWAYREAIPEITALIDSGRFEEAVALAGEAEVYIAGAAELEDLWPRMARDVSLTATPADAQVSISSIRLPRFAGEDVFESGEWKDLGRTPIELRRLPFGTYRVRVEEPGFRTRELMRGNRFAEDGAPESWRLAMGVAGRVPEGMISLGPKKLRANLRGVVDLDPDPDRALDSRYLFGRFEVTNAEFKRFVDAGGYADRDYWRHDFVRDGEVLSWDDAMQALTDASGRPGPATWDGGTYPPGQDEHPVGGVSWFEAAAYAEFAGASLPTIYHWLGARDGLVDMSVFGNFRGRGPMPVGSTEFGPFGVYDLAGNVREWAYNSAGDMRFILGGGWADPGYVYHNGDVAPPWDRSARNGIRLVDHGEIPDDDLTLLRAPVQPEFGTVRWSEQAVSDEVFDVLADRYAYDPSPLDATVDAIDDSSPYWTRETVSFRAAYSETMFGYLFLPKNATPPFQTLLYFPGAGSIGEISSENLQSMDMIDYVLRSGRAVMHPVYASTYERFDGIPGNGRSRSRAYVDRKVRWIQDARRALDYLETRADIDQDRIGYWGLSWGAEISPITLAVDDRLRAGILMDGGALLASVLPEAHEANFAPRVRVPILMINGRYDYLFPVETAQDPFFEILGTAEPDKTRELYDTGHIAAATEFDAVMERVARWLDEVFGPVR